VPRLPLLLTLPHCEQIGSAQEVGRGHNQADDLNQPKKYSMLNSFMLRNKTERKEVR